jgi:nitrate reductase beta subunit
MTKHRIPFEGENWRVAFSVEIEGELTPAQKNHIHKHLSVYANRTMCEIYDWNEDLERRYSEGLNDKA